MSLETKLFELINKNEFTVALPLLEHVDINALDEDGCSLLMAAIENNINTSEERYVFMEHVLSNPEFLHVNKPVDGTIASPFQSVINLAESRAVDLLIKYKDTQKIQVVFHKEELLYELHAKGLECAKKRIAANPNSAWGDKLDDEEKILASLLQVTVHHAIKTDDPSILQRLSNAGAKLHDSLKDGTFAIDLAKNQEGLKVHQWLLSYIKEQVTSSPAYALATKSLEDKLREEKEKLTQNHAKSTSVFIQNTFLFYEYKPDQKPTEQPEPKGKNTPK